MCLAFLSSERIQLNFLGEYMFLSGTRDGVGAREVYDLFFRANRDSHDTTIICVSPHNLIENESGEKLRVIGRPGPGAGGPDDAVYEVGGGYDSDFARSNGKSTVLVAGGKDPFKPQQIPYEGKAIVNATFAVPESVRLSPEWRHVMGEVGTVFEMRLGDLSSGQSYAMRIEVSPHRLLGFPPKRCVYRDWKRLGYPIGTWSQSLCIYSVASCLLDFKRLVESCGSEKVYAEAAAVVSAVVEDQSLTLIPVQNHRLVVISPQDGDIQPQPSIGSIWYRCGGQFPGENNQTFAEWGAGTDVFWEDDPEALCREIWEYLDKAAKREPKRKEDVTSGINAPYHPNVGLVIDWLRDEGKVVKQDGDVVSPLYSPHVNMEELFCRLASDRHLLSRFRWKGYKVEYSVIYEFWSKWSKFWLLWKRYIVEIAFWLALLSFLATIYFGFWG